MNEWKDLKKDGYPDQDCVCVVYKDCWLSLNTIASYHNDNKIFVTYSSDHCKTYTLDIDKYLIIPSPWENDQT